jgi:hypothetical protein
MNHESASPNLDEADCQGSCRAALSFEGFAI